MIEILDELDKAVEANKREKAKAEATLKVKLDEIKAKIDPFAREAEKNLTDILEITPRCRKVIAKARDAGFGSDQVVGTQIGQLQAMINNAGFLQKYLKDFAELSADKLLLESGEFDHNAPMRFFAYFSSRFMCGNGCHRAMERAIEQIEYRVSQLVGSRRWNEQTTGGGKVVTPVTTTVTTPIAKADTPEVAVLSDLDRD